MGSFRVPSRAHTTDLGLSYGAGWAGVKAIVDGDGLDVNVDGTKRTIIPTGAEAITAAETLTAADNGKTIFVNSTSSLNITLPAASDHLAFRIFIKAPAAALALHKITPATGDTINCKSVTAAASKYIGIDQATEAAGDYVELFGIDGDTWWMYTNTTGVTRET